MDIRPTRLDGPLVFVPDVHRDERGFFTRTFDAAAVAAAGVDPGGFVQDSQSRSSGGVLRGLHGRVGTGEAKLVRVARGRVFDVIVDARPTSPTFGAHEYVELDDEAHRVLYVPRGFLHGHLALSAEADVCYRIDAAHDPVEDVSVHYADPDLAIPWPREPRLLSAKDRAAGTWADLVRRLRGA